MNNTIKVYSLLDRVKPELMEALDNDLKDFPLSLEYVKTKLSSVYSIGDMPYAVFLDLERAMRNAKKPIQHGYDDQLFYSSQEMELFDLSEI